MLFLKQKGGLLMAIMSIGSLLLLGVGVVAIVGVIVAVYLISKK